jgi:hypothetical protein
LLWPLADCAGGVLSSPAEQYPKVFGSNSFLKNYPYALPTFVTGAFGASAAILCALLVKEVGFLNDLDD